MAKQQRGSSRAQNRPATPPPSSGKSSGKSSGQRPSGQKSSSQKSSGSWQPNRVSATKQKGGLSRTALITIGAIVVGVMIVAFVMVQQLSRPATPATTDLITPKLSVPASVPTDGRTMGDPNAPATVDLYGDFRCSACYYFTEMGTEDNLIKNDVATGRAKIVWHDYLTIDQDGTTASRDAANAAMCAADQGKFWTMHDWLYANQSPTEAPSAFTQARLLAIGEAAGMDMSTFTPCVQNGTHNQAIADEQASAPKEVTGTPTVFVNGQLVGANGQVPTYDQIKAAIDAVIGAASPAPSTSVAPSG
jgi:protein-disulfide isomerase